MMRRLVAAAVLACIVGSAAGQGEKVKKIESAAWVPIAPQVVPITNLPALPERSAGCLVIGYYVMADGTTAKSRVMQGAYTNGTSDQIQEAFAGAALAASSSWKFQYKGRFKRPGPEFKWNVVGFGPAGNELRTGPIQGLEAQDPRVRGACDIVDLATWGKKHAVPSEKVLAHDRILTPYDEPSEAFWTAAGEMMPPRYPAGAYMRDVEGCVIVGVIVGKDGIPDRFRIVESRFSRGTSEKGKKLLEEASARAVSQWRFAPGPDNPERIPAFLQIPVDFFLGIGNGPVKTDCQPRDIRPV